MNKITKLKLHNFRRFEELTIDFNNTVNLLIGDNEAGKSTVLSALDLVISGSISKLQAIGLESVFNATTIERFLNGEKKYADLPELMVEIFLSEQNNPDLNGQNHSLRPQNFDGLRLKCQPRDDLSGEIVSILSQKEPNFPFEFYDIKFQTFSGISYTGYKKYLSHLLLDNSQIDSEHARREYIKTVYYSASNEIEINQHKNKYRSHKTAFRDDVLKDINNRLDDYEFAIRTGSKANLESDLTILENNIPLENRGKGRQCLIKTEFALVKKEGKKGIDILLLEEPENHLSHLNMSNLIQRISSSKNKQIIISTHNNIICSRLDLRKAIFLNSGNDTPILLSGLSSDTAKFFMKAPDNNILELVLSKKALLVEGDAEFILMEAFYNLVTGENLLASDIHVISVGGTSFKRYLELANLLSIKTAVITDNDKDAAKCEERYSQHISDTSKIFFDVDETRWTFEVAMYQNNLEICNELFGKNRKTLSVEQFMLENKADAAFELLDKKKHQIVVPKYIEEAILWLKS